MLVEMKRKGYLKPPLQLTISSRDLMRIALRNFRSETLRYEFDAPWFAQYPISVYWPVPGAAGVIIHSFSWAPLVVDYAALGNHDTATFEKWTVDGDYIHRNFPNPDDVYVVTDSDEIALVSFTKESDLHFELEPYLAWQAPWIASTYKIGLIRTLRESEVMDPLKRRIFPTPVYLHADEISPTWSVKRHQVSRLIGRACGPPGFLERWATVVIMLTSPGLAAHVLGSFGGRFASVLWLWRYRRFAWQRVKEKAGLVPGRSRVDDGRDWVSPTLSLMNPLWSVRAMLRERVSRKP